MNWIEVFGAIPALYLLVKQAVVDVESDAPGSQKKEAVMAVVKAALDALSSMGMKIPATAVLTIASGLVDAVVAILNVAGVFKKKTGIAQ